MPVVELLTKSWHLNMSVRFLPSNTASLNDICSNTTIMWIVVGFLFTRTICDLYVVPSNHTYQLILFDGFYNYNLPGYVVLLEIQSFRLIVKSS